MANQMPYSEIKAEVEDHAKFDPSEDFSGGIRDWINKGVRAVSREYGGEWNSLLVEQASVAINSDGKTIDLPTDWVKTKELKIQKDTTTKGIISQIPFRVSNVLRRGRDYRMIYSQPTDLTSQRIPQIELKFDGGAGEDRFLTYWRQVKFFANTSSEQYPDIPFSGKAIVAASKLLMAEQNDEEPNIIERLRNEYRNEIRLLRVIDVDVDGDGTQPNVDNDSEDSYVSYDTDIGGDFDA